jgi:phospholipid/cholesterol/gamma-HCH transport system substrate-binding protein
MLETDRKRRLRVGVFTAGLLAVLAVVVLMLGRKQGLFVRHVQYLARFEHVGGLVPGAAVWLNGVVVGSVDDVELPTDPKQRQINVAFQIRARLARRIRSDSTVRIRTLGLLGDRYLEISSGSPSKPELPPGSVIPSVEPTDVAQVLSQGGDAMTNVLAISSSLRRILERVEKGEGVLGELTTSPESGRRVVARLGSVLDQTDALLHDVREGKGVIGKLFTDKKLETQLTEDLAGFAHAARRVTEALARDLQRDDSVVAELLRDPQGRERLQKVLDGIARAADATTAVGKELTEGQGTIPRLMHDEEFARTFLLNLGILTDQLRSVAEKLDHGQGSASELINDPTLVRDLENVVRGVQDSKLATWFIRNRREAGERAAKRTPIPTPRR